MNYLVSSTTGQTYHRLVKPLLFRQSPDRVHDRLLQTAGRLQRHQTVRRLITSSWAFQHPVLSQNLLGLTFANPVGLSAGFDKNLELAPLIRAVGFGFMEGGSITLAPCTGNPRPWFHRLPHSGSLVVYAGLANRGVEAIIDQLRSYPDGTFTGFPLNISVAKTNAPGVCSDAAAIADYVGTLEALQAARLGDLITLNISCPNAYGGEPFTTPIRLQHLLREVDRIKLTQPVFIKMPCHLPWPEFKALIDIAASHNVAGLTISNLAKDRGHLKLMDPLPDSIKGGLSGRPTRLLSDELIYQTRRTYGDRFTIIGVGGIFSAADAYTKIKLGADLVELITGMIFEGPQLIGQINQELAQLLHRDGYTNIAQAVGADLSAT